MQLLAPELSSASKPVGYGCSQLLGGITQRQSMALLDAAFDAGIRHFDTAPSYGYGHAESVLGETLRAKRGQVTITTKYGLRPPRNQNLLGMARRVLLPVIKQVPSLKARLSRAAGGLTARAPFSPEELRSSIEASLRALKTDCVDILLLHEAMVEDLSDALFEELERNVASGNIRRFGIGSEAAKVAQIHRVQPRFCPVLQFEWSVLSGAKPNYPGSLVITHRSLSSDFARLRDWLRANPRTARSWSKELALDIGNPAVLSRLMLAAARHANPQGLTLFSSRSVENIRTNTQALLDDAARPAGAAFAALVARDAAAIVAGAPAERQRAVSRG